MKAFQSLILIFIFNLNLYALVDLGLHGDTTSVEGESFIDELERRYKKIDKNELEEKVINAKKKSMFVDNNMSTCKETKKRYFEPTIIMDRDIKIPMIGTLLYKKGEKYNILEEQNINFGYHLLFINSEDEIQIALAQQLTNKSYVMVAQGDISDYIKNGLNIKIARKETELKMFKINCLPTVVTQSGNRFIINEFNPEDLVSKE